MTINPGLVPKNYEELNELNLPRSINKLIQERESIYQTTQERRRLRNEQKSISHSNERADSLQQKARARAATINAESKDSLSSNDRNEERSRGTIVENNKPDSAQALHEEKTEEFKKDTTILVNEEKERQKLLFIQSPNLSISIRRNTYVDKILSKKCYQCDSIKPPTVHHCASCKGCIVYMDHHCPWINNCVGLYTLKLFILFNFYALISTCYALGLLMNHGFKKLAVESHNYALIDSGEVFLCCFAVFQLILFGLFITLVFFDQIAITMNRLTTLEKVRLYDNRLLKFKKKGYKNFRQVFGSNLSFSWFIPIPIKTKINVEDLYN